MGVIRGILGPEPKTLIWVGPKIKGSFEAPLYRAKKPKGMLVFVGPLFELPNTVDKSRA